MSRRDDRWAANRQDLETAAKAAGIDVDVMVKIAGFESGFNPDARPIATSDPSKNTIRQYDGTMAISSAHGYGQFLDATWHEMINRHGAKYGVENAASLTSAQANSAALREDTSLQASMLAEFTRENMEKAAQYGGQDVDANVYAMHNLGTGDGPKFLAALRDNPDARVNTVLSAKVINGNPALYDGGTITLAEAYRKMGQHMDNYQAYADEATRGLPSGSLSAGGRDRTPSDPMADGVLSPNERGDAIEQMQQQLNTLGFTGRNGQPLVTDGAYGGNTEHAVRRFQEANGLDVDGIAGRNTLQALQEQAPVQQAAQQQAAQQNTQQPAQADPALQPTAQPQQVQPAQAQDPTQQAAQQAAEQAAQQPAQDPAQVAAQAAGGVVLNRAYELTQQYDHVQYGFGKKNPENGEIDCSGWVVKLANESMSEINEQAGRTVFPASERYSPGYDHAAGIIEKTVDRSGVRLEGDQITADALREGMIIGEDNGDLRWDRGRYEGIDHITMVVRDPTDGQLKISQSRGGEGVELSSLDTYLERKQANGVQLIATDPLAPARDMIRENGQVRGGLPQQADHVVKPNSPAGQTADHPTLRDQSRGPAVGQLQEQLNAMGYTGRNGQPLAVDKAFGPHTQEAVRAFQRDNGLGVDGIVGPKTHEALDKAREQARAETAQSQPQTQPKAEEPKQATAPLSAGAALSGIFDAAKQGDAAALQQAMSRLADTAAGRAFAEARDNAQQQLAREAAQAQPQQQSASTAQER